MRLIPVIDLLKGQAVHAFKGERENYQPVKSVLCDTADPVALARSFRDRLGLCEIYIADLDAIQGFRQTSHRDLITVLARDEQILVMLDAGVSDVEGVHTWLDTGVNKVVIGAETLCTLTALRELPANIDRNRLVFSLDMRAAKISSKCPELSAISPMQALAQLYSAGWQEILLLDLNRVGSGGGIDNSLVVKARLQFPDLNLMVGGGIAGPEQLVALKSLGLTGVLVATALHRGSITAQHLSALLE
jgi:phosphoribosylformimino-5-aminoimidazole carboxamide ribotide isomerase